MREVKLKTVNYLRGSINLALVNEDRLEFRNGVALAPIMITASNWPQSGTIEYECCGLIDENFCEVYSDSLKADFVAERNLMALRYNEWGFRVGDNDFIIKVNCGDDGHSWTEYRHIRIVDGIPKLMNNIGTPQRTSNESILITGYKSNQALYDVEKTLFVTPRIHSIKESEVKEGCFDAIARVVPNKDNEYNIIDNLYFRMDSEGRVASSVLSSLTNGALDVQEGIYVKELLDKRVEELALREKEFEEYVEKLTTGEPNQTLKLTNGK